MRWRLALWILISLAGLSALWGVTAGRAAAGRLTDTQPPGAPNTLDAFAHFSPTGPLTVVVGSKFTLDLEVNSGSNSVAVAQSYLTFTDSVLQNVDATQPGCVTTSTVTSDLTSFDFELQNEVCNSSTPCDFGRIIDPPASISFASGASPNATPSAGD